LTSIKIKKLVYGGYGLGRTQGKVIFVPFALPGDELEIRITRDYKCHAFGEITRIVSRPGASIEPDCRYFFKCGGCSYRHMDYGEELRWKKVIFQELLGDGLSGELDLTVHGSSRTRHYRNRVDFQIRNGEIGFFHRASHDLLQVDACPLAEKPINRFLKKVLRSGVFKKNPGPDRIKLMSAGEKVYALLACPGKKGTMEKNTGKIARALAAIPGNSGVAVEGVPWAKKRNTGEATSRRLNFYNDKRWEVSLQSFCQPNLHLNRKMITLYLDEIRDSHNILDLYSGSGNFTIPALVQGKKVTSVESNSFSIGDLEREKREENFQNLEIIPSSVIDFLRKGPAKGWDTVVVDPPREGMKREAALLTDLEPKKIIYISCNPTTFVRDAKTLTRGGFLLKTSYLLDMFPRTYHFESLNCFYKGV